MSHIVSIQAKLRDRESIYAACSRLGLAPPFDGTVQLYGGEIKGLIVQLPEWQYPVVIDLASGELRYDNFGGVWGEDRFLNAFLQAYSVEKTRIESHKRGYAVHEQSLEDGSIKLHVTRP